MHRSNSKIFQFSKPSGYHLFKGTKINIDPHTVMPFHLTRNMDLARESKVFPPWERFENKVAPRPPAEREHSHRPHHRAGASKGGHPGHRISSERRQHCPCWCAHPGSFPFCLPPRHCQLRPPAATGQVGFAVRRRCTWKLTEKLREKAVRQGKNGEKINDNAKSLQMQKL